MEELKKQLEEKRKTLHALMHEIRELEERILDAEWHNKPECDLSFSSISEGKCPHANTYRSTIYCKNINCHK